MPLIITATDYSEVSENAVIYACDLALAENAKLIILHSFIIPVMFSDIPMPGTLINDAQTDAEEQMKTLTAKISASYPTLAIEGKVIYGSALDGLEELTEANNSPWLIVVGNSNAAADSPWPDNGLMDAFRKSAFPVLAVPAGQKYQPVKNICFAFDNKHKGNDAALVQITDLSKHFNATLHVLNIQTGGDTAENRQDIDTDAKTGLASANPQYHIVRGADNIDYAIHNFADSNKIDWLIMIPRKHSFFEGLFHRSHTRSVTHTSNCPILALHDSAG